MTLDLTETRESGFLRFSGSETINILSPLVPEPQFPQAAHEKQYRLSLRHVFATRQ